MLVGAAGWGWVADKYGRKRTYIMTCAFTLVFGLGSALAPSFGALLALRGLTGVGIGGLHVGYTLFTEYLPAAKRANILLLMVIFWAVGSMFEAALAWLVLSSWGWRWLLFFSALPMGLCLGVAVLLDESPRFLLVTHQEKRLQHILRKMARMNGAGPPPDDILLPPKAERGALRLLLDPNSHLRRTTITLWFLWFSVSFVYYGIVMLVTVLYADGLLDKYCERLPDGLELGHSAPGGDCSNLFTDSDYLDVFVTSAAELPGIMFAGALLMLGGRRSSIGTCFTGASASIMMLFVCVSEQFETGMLSTGRAMAAGAFQLIFVYSPEVYPTNLRSVGMGYASSFARVGGILTPFVATSLAEANLPAALTIYTVVALLATAATLSLPVETAGKGLPETHHESRAHATDE